MARKLDKLTIRGFKSIEKLEDFPLGDLNVLIGANGAGKSNFVDFFRLLRAMVEQRMQGFFARHWPTDGYFFDGVSRTNRIEADLHFGEMRFAFTLEPTDDGRAIITREKVQHATSGEMQVGGTGWESLLFDSRAHTEPEDETAKQVKAAISRWQVYHFHDTSMTAGMRRDVGVEQSDVLFPDAPNLAAFLLNLRTVHRQHYELLRKTLRRVAPYFDDFELRVTKSSPQDTVRLTWRRLGSDYVFSPGHLSDGTIRFLCLATVLTQPNPPTTIVLDEPELGLHPEALAVLGGLVRSAAARMQIVLATQSPVLLSEFEPEQIVTVDQLNGASTFNRLDPAALTDWL